jgi:ribosome-binding factor A
MGVRQQRLADEIRDILASCFAAGEMSDPRLEFITITAVKLTSDLQLASAYFRIMDGESEARVAEVKRGLASASTFLRRRLADSLDLRRVPNLRFFYDESIERGARIEGLLSQIDPPV